jgi:site-specific recombinase XerD
VAALLKSFAYDQGLKLDERLFTIKRTRAWKNIWAAAAKAGITKRVYPHLLRHSDAI